MSEKVYIAADHAGYSLKQKIIEKFPTLVDLGPSDESRVDYPDFAEKVAKSVAQSKSKGILVCGSGIGMAISANKVAGVRAASAWDVTSARLSREHNDANVLCLGARLTGVEVALEIVATFLKTPFEGGRHQQRVDKMTALEGKK